MVSAVTAADPRAGSLVFLVFALLAGHSIGSMAMLVMPAVAPDVARDYGVDHSYVGYQISLVTVGLLFSLLFLGNLSRKLGPARTNQMGHIALAISMLILLVPSPAVAIVGSIAIGVGYGFLAPSASALMVQFTPSSKRNIVFSIQQTGVPFGGVLAALIAPPIAVAVGWRWSLVVTAVLLLGAAALMQRRRAEWDADRVPDAPAIALNPLATLGMIWRDRRLRLMAFIGSCFSWGQFVVASFTVVACVTMLGMSLIVAGTVLMVVQIGNIGGRIVAGWIADRIGSARVLGWISGMWLVNALVAATMTPAWPLLWLYLLFGFLGMTTGAWAGLVMAEIGRLAPTGQVSTAVGGSLAYVNMGKFIGPIIFVNVYLATGSYGIAFATLAVPATAAIYCISRLRRV